MHIYQKYIEEFKEISLENKEFVAEKYLKTLQIFSEKEFFSNFLNYILTNKNLLNEIASQSYLHQNGFSKLILHTDNNLNLRLRIHIWSGNTDKAKRCACDIHNHSFDFASSIIIGSLTNEIYEISEYGNKYYRHIYQIDDTTCEASLKVCDEVLLALKENKQLIRGDVYSQSKHKLHAIYPNENKMTATLVLQQINHGNSSNVFKTLEEPFFGKIGLSGELMTLNQVENIIHKLLKEIKN